MTVCISKQKLPVRFKANRRSDSFAESRCRTKSGDYYITVEQDAVVIGKVKLLVVK